MHYYRGILTLDDGTEIPLRQIGKGMFSKAFVTTTGKPRVYLITQETDGGDYSKEQLSHLSSRYLPAVTKEGCIGDADTCVYSMPLYRAPLMKADSAKAWKQYKALKTCWDEAQETVRKRLFVRYGYNKAYRMMRYEGQSIMWEVVECARRDKEVPAGLVRALDDLMQAAANYGNDYSFEFAPRNLATTASGHLILLDSVFSMESVEKQRRR